MTLAASPFLRRIARSYRSSLITSRALLHAHRDVALDDVGDHRDRVAGLHEPREMPGREQPAPPRDVFDRRAARAVDVVHACEHVALQRGLQANVRLQGDDAVFYRVYEHGGRAQTALVVLNKSDWKRSVAIGDAIEEGTWLDAFGGTVELGRNARLEVPAHGVRVLLREQPLSARARRALAALQALPATGN